MLVATTAPRSTPHHCDVNVTCNTVIYLRGSCSIALLKNMETYLLVRACWQIGLKYRRVSGCLSDVQRAHESHMPHITHQLLAGTMYHAWTMEVGRLPVPDRRHNVKSVVHGDIFMRLSSALENICYVMLRQLFHVIPSRISPTLIVKLPCACRCNDNLYDLTGRVAATLLYTPTY